MTWLDWYTSLAKPSWTPAPSTISQTAVMAVRMSSVITAGRTVGLSSLSGIIASSCQTRSEGTRLKSAISARIFGPAFAVHRRSTRPAANALRMNPAHYLRPKILP